MGHILTRAQNCEVLVLEHLLEPCCAGTTPGIGPWWP